MNIFKILIVSCLAISCSAGKGTMKNQPLAVSPLLLELDSTLTSPMFDHGAWFGISLPYDDLGLAAPLLLSDSNGYTFREQILSVTYSEGDSKSKGLVNHYLPGSLAQETTTENSQLNIKTIYLDDQTVLQAYEITNTNEDQVEITLNWSFPEPNSIISNITQYNLSNAILELEFPSVAIEGEQSYEMRINLAPGDKNIIYLTLHHRFKEGNRTLWSIKEAESAFLENNARWTQYVSKYRGLPFEKRMLASKCIQTLVNNWRQPAGELKYEGLFPSYDYEWFHGFWSWDSWKQAIALVTFEPELAKNQIRTMYHFQDEFGMIADVVYRDTLIEKHNWRDTKPPLSGWAIRKVFEETKDTVFLKELMPKLLKYHSWWYKHRDHNNNGLCEFGSTDGTRVAAGWESGMDNAVRFDDAKMVKINDNAWSLDQESVDLNSYLYNEKIHISKLLGALGSKDSSQLFAEAAQELKSKIQTTFYDVETDYFYDISTASSKRLKVIGPEAWTTLWAEVATVDQAEEIVDKILDSLHFNTFLPFSTLSSSHPKFNPEKGYWRGPVWIDQAYFALEGIRLYGYDEEYAQMREKLFKRAEGLLKKGGAIRENYDPRNGKGLNAKHFSWSASHILMLLNTEVDPGER